jgi:O-methyltransferase domain
VNASPFTARVELHAGDFNTDDLPKGADLAWVSAIIHQNSPDQNRALYKQVAIALEQNGWIYIRDIIMESSRTAPVAGALFAVNMLSGTDVELVRRDEGMHSIVRARLL